MGLLGKNAVPATNTPTAGLAQPVVVGDGDIELVAVLSGSLTAITAGRGGTVRLWRADDHELVPASEPQRGLSEHGVASVAVGQIAIRSLAVTAERDGTARLCQIGHDGLTPTSDAQPSDSLACAAEKLAGLSDPLAINRGSARGDRRGLRAGIVEVIGALSQELPS